MATAEQLPARPNTAHSSGRTLLSLAFVAGFFLRLRLAWATFLNPDEALHYYLSHQPSIKLAYEASLPTAHPPLMILFLHFWSQFGRSELFLRLPFVLAGTLFCWLVFLWVRRIADQQTAFSACVLALFAPSLISLSAELRQYPFLLLFCACSLYCLERALDELSPNWMLWHAGFLYLSLFTHYSALIFAATTGLYAIFRLLRCPRTDLVTYWITGQLGALALCVFLFLTQISKLQQAGLPSEIAATWLRTSIFHHEDHVLAFAWSRTLRLFRYVFSHGTIGLLGLLLFTFAIVMLFRSRGKIYRFRQRSIALLLLSPFVITLALALFGIFPYGGTRHDVLLAIFAISGVAIGLARLPLALAAKPARIVKTSLLALGLLTCNLFPSPSGPYIRPRDQRRELMAQAISSLRALPLGSVIFTDDQGSMVLNYYLCGDSMPLAFTPQSEPILLFRCGDYSVLAATHTQAGFDRSEFPEVLGKAWQSVPGEATLQLFQSGWIDDREQEWLVELRSLGGNPQTFGPNVLVSPIRRNATTQQTF